MSSFGNENTDRRGLLRRALGASAATAALPLVARLWGGEGFSLIASAQAAANVGVQRNQGDMVHIPGASVAETTLAEWIDPKGPTGPFRIAASKTALERAPATAGRYQAKLFNFPSGSLRVLTYKKGTPVVHMVTYETEIYVLQGSATLTPLPGHAGKPVKVSAGDALSLPSGVFENQKPTEDFVILQALVNHTVHGAKSAIVTAKQAASIEMAQWQVDGKEFSAAKPDELKKAPKTATRLGVKRYAFDGNSFRIVTLKKGGRTNSETQTRADVILYVAKGKLRRTQAGKTYDVVAGDAFREKIGDPGYWDVAEDSLLIITDAPVLPNMLPPASI